MNRLLKATPLVVLCALIIAVPSVWANWVLDGVAICTATGNQGGPTIVSDGAGGAIVTWVDNRSGSNYDIYAQRVNASGAVQWTANGVALCTATGNQENPQITSDGAGGAIVTWEDHRSGTLDIYVQRVNAAGAVQWTANGVALRTATGDPGYPPAIASDGAGGAIVTWEDQRSGNYDIYAQRVNAAGTSLWTANGVPLCMAAGDQMAPTLVSDYAGGAIVAWDDSRVGMDIYAQRVNASGVAQWTANGVELAMGGEVPAITSDGAGGAIVTWGDLRSLSEDVYAQKVNASGVVQWTANGVALCTAAGHQYYPTITSDGAGGAIVTWCDTRNGNYDIYVQRVIASGAVQWTANGVALCTATGNQFFPIFTSDGASGAIVTWTDYRSGNADIYLDIYAQRVNASGAVQWTANGVALCTATGGQGGAAIASDGAGGAILTWGDGRSLPGSDVYAQRIDANGFAVLTAADMPAAPVELHQNYPNPFNPTTMVTYSVPEKCNVTLEIYDVSGKCIACLVDRQKEKGSYAVEWNGEDEKGSSVASGIYLCRLAAGNQMISRKMVLLR